MLVHRHVSGGSPGWAMMALVGLLVTGCTHQPTAPAGAGAGSSKHPAPIVSQTSADPQPLPGYLTPGNWQTKAFRPGFTFSTAFDNWDAVEDGPHIMQLQTHNDQYVLVASPGRVIDQHDPNKTLPWPKDYVSWVLGHPGIEAVGKPRPVTVGGIEAMEVDARVTAAPRCPYGFADRCWRLTPSDDPGENYTVGLDWEFRFISLKVDGRPVFIEYDAYPSIDPAFAAAAEEVIRTLRWSS